MKKILFLITSVALLGACCNSNKTNTADTSGKKECASISVDSFLVVAGANVGKELTVQGTVDHVCKHGGKRVKLLSTLTGETIHGEATEKVSVFNAELEGSDVCLTGKVLETKIDLAYVDEWETKEKEAMAKNAEESEMEHKEGVDHHAKLEEIKKYREQIAASEKGYISFYALDVTDFQTCEISDKEACCGGPAAAETLDAPCCEKEAATPCCGEKEATKEAEGSKKEADKAAEAHS